jgi:acetyl-CoA carboxylase carboxyltransferase component
MSWEHEVDGIEARRRLARAHGGAEAVQRQHASGRLTIRERIDALVDPGSFDEQGAIAGHAEHDAEGRLVGFTPANYVLGLARMDGRRVAIGGEDFTQKGGSPNPAGLRKSVFAEDLALRYRVPLVRFLEGAGGSVGKPGERSTPGEGMNVPPRFLSVMQVLAAVPVVSSAMGSVAGLPAARLVASHLSLMTRHTSQVLIAGPAVVERAQHVKIDKQALGGPEVHLKSGVVDRVCEDEQEVFGTVRRFLSYLPSNIWETAPRADCEDEPERCDEELLSIVPRDRRRPTKMRRVIEHVVDRDSLFETARGFGRTQITGLARLAGQPVGVIANDPHIYAGAMTADAAQKVRRLVDLCDTFHLPIISFVDEPGFMIGPEAERSATIRHGTALLCAVMQSTVPWASVIVRRVFGVAGAAHFGPGGHVLAWPSAEHGALPVEGGVAVAFRREIEAAPDPDVRRRELEDQLSQARDPFAYAEAYAVNDLIDPRRTRPELCRWVEWIQPQLAAHLGPRSYSFRP